MDFYNSGKDIARWFIKKVNTTRMALTLFKEVKAIHRICVKGENGLPLQATCFPVDERRATSSATAPFRGLPVSPSHQNQAAFLHF